MKSSHNISGNIKMISSIKFFLHYSILKWYIIQCYFFLTLNIPTQNWALYILLNTLPY